MSVKKVTTLKRTISRWIIKPGTPQAGDTKADDFANQTESPVASTACVEADSAETTRTSSGAGITSDYPYPFPSITPNTTKSVNPQIDIGRGPELTRAKRWRKRRDSMESLKAYIRQHIIEFEASNPGPLFPLEEYGRTCFMHGCDEWHIENREKQHAFVAHCDCDIMSDYNVLHRHTADFGDFIDPPHPSLCFSSLHPLRRRREHEESTISTFPSTPIDCEASSSSFSFEFQVCTINSKSGKV